MLPELSNSKMTHFLASFQTSRKRFRKLQEAIWLTVINEIFIFPPHFNPFGYVNYFYELYSDDPNYSTQKWNIWVSFQTSRKRFRNLQEAILLTVRDCWQKNFKFFSRLYLLKGERVKANLLKVANFQTKVYFFKLYSPHHSDYKTTIRIHKLPFSMMNFALMQSWKCKIRLVAN